MPTTTPRFLIALLFGSTVALLMVSTAHGFVTPSMVPAKNHISKPLFAKKNKKTGKGFGKVEEPPKPKAQSATPAAPTPAPPNQIEQDLLSSVSGGSTEVPKIDESVPVEERTASLLRDKYGLRTQEEIQAAAKREEKIKEQRKKVEQWKAMANEGQDFDIMQVLPAPVLVAIDTFLKAGVAICTTLFVLSGIGITIEAWSKASNNPLPENIDNFIVNTIEPNFTPGLLVLLGFSVSLGAFAALQLSSASSTYREDK